jgi:hypothetical protein
LTDFHQERCQRPLQKRFDFLFEEQRRLALLPDVVMGL